MLKGRTNLDHESMLIYVPKTGRSSKVFKVTSPVLKMSVFLGFMLTVVVGLTITLLYFINQNKIVNERLDAVSSVCSNEMKVLSDYVSKQAGILENRLTELSLLEHSQEELNMQLKDLSAQLSLLTDKYANRITLASSSVTVNNVAEFAQEAVVISQALEKLLEANSEGKKELVDFSEAADTLSEYLEAIPTLWPTTSSTVHSSFGMRNHPILNEYKNHTGIDIGGYAGDEIYAAASGIVTSVIYDRTGYGYHLKIQHSDSITTLYAHCSAIIVKQWEQVEKGQVIAYVGRTGVATGPHLHFEIRINNVPINPELFIK